jgi:hypothetical protein
VLPTLSSQITFEDGPDATGVDRLMVPEQRAQLGRQRRDYLKAMAADRKATDWSATFEVAAPEPDDRMLPGHAPRHTLLCCTPRGMLTCRRLRRSWIPMLWIASQTGGIVKSCGSADVQLVSCLSSWRASMALR